MNIQCILLYICDASVPWNKYTYIYIYIHIHIYIYTWFYKIRLRLHLNLLCGDTEMLHHKWNISHSNGMLLRSITLKKVDPPTFQVGLPLHVYRRNPSMHSKNARRESVSSKLVLHELEYQLFFLLSFFKTCFSESCSFLWIFYALLY